MPTKNKYSVLVLGLDGATYDLMLPWIDQGYLPALGNLIGRGAWSRLESTIPPHTPCAWSSFMTGKNPGKHGLFDFAEPVPGDYQFRFANASSRQGESLWGILSRHARRVGVVNVPMTYPPESVNGYLVSGLDAPHEQSQFTYPQSLRQEIQEQDIAYRIDLQHMGNMRTDSGRRRRLHELCEIETNRNRAFEYLRQRNPSDFEMLVYTATDRVQHHFWHYMDSSHDKHDPAGAEQFRNSIRDVYVHLDGLIANVLKQVDENTIVMLMSDHGFGPTSSVRIRLNQALASRGLLRFAREGGVGRSQRTVGAVLDRLLRSTLSSGAKRKIASTFPRLRAWFENLDEAKIDWSQTTAYLNEAYRTCPALWLNREDIKPQGTVANEDEEQALKATEQALLQLKDPTTGRPVISHVYRTSDIYHGPCTAKAPDLIPSWWEDGFLIDQSIPDSPDDQIVTRADQSIRGGVEFTGGHRLDGVFAMAGGPVRPGEFTGAKIIDVAPTVLYLMGLPIPADMDGRPLLEAIDPAFVESHPPQFEGQQDSDDNDHHTPQETFTEQENELVAQRLRSLGYI